ncbi:MAG: hypothetical protein Q8T08_05320 [Ignavibacteria bacterium]|nr:hypothetical protein [Ignavibacteria bacterium]
MRPQSIYKSLLFLSLKKDLHWPIQSNIQAFIQVHPDLMLNYHQDAYTHLREVDYDKITESFMQQLKHNNMFYHKKKMGEIAEKLKTGEIDRNAFKSDVKNLLTSLINSIKESKGV